MAKDRVATQGSGRVVSDEPGDQRRSTRKRRAILDAAQTAFLARGFARTTMDDIAAIAAVSKQTVYKQFNDKRTLFAAVVTGEIADAESLTHDLVAALATTQDLERDLRRFARQHATDVTQPHLLRLRRIVIAEAEQFPELARTWYAEGPGRARSALAEQLRALADRGVLVVDDPLLAAELLNWLIIGSALNHALFHPDVALTRRELHRNADEGVRVFLAAYGSR